MAVEDAAALHEFFRQLPEEDLLFLRQNVRDRAVIDRWAQNIAAGRVVSILAWSGSRVVGYATLQQSEVEWTRHVGEIRVGVSTDYRRSGLGRKLTEEVFKVALEQGIEKIQAQMPKEQVGAIQVFEHLGFSAEALLEDQVRTRDGKLRDLVLMCHHVKKVRDRLTYVGLEDAAADGSH
jgi:L-amino acid N-acyltransferase YncA